MFTSLYDHGYVFTGHKPEQGINLIGVLSPMNRRDYLRFTVAGGSLGLVGCTNFTYRNDVNSTDHPDGHMNYSGPLELPVPRDKLTRGAERDAIPAIVDPVFDTDWSGLTIETQYDLGPFGEQPKYIQIEPRLEEDDLIIGVVRNAQARAYPFRILNWHEVVNDNFFGPLLVSYCPLCGSGVTAVRKAGGEISNFGVSGLLFRNGLVMYDEKTESLWSQLYATAISGELTGEGLKFEHATVTTWENWGDENPDTLVLRPPPDSGTIVPDVIPRNYTRNPYASYQRSSQIGLGGESRDDRLHPKTEVIGIEHGGVARAYPVDEVRKEGVINDEVGSRPVVVTTTAGGSPVAYIREVENSAVYFTSNDENHLMGGGSRWLRSTGTAVDGPHENTRLEPANDISPLYWFAWITIHPGSSLYE